MSHVHAFTNLLNKHSYSTYSALGTCCHGSGHRGDGEQGHSCPRRGQSQLRSHSTEHAGKRGVSWVLASHRRVPHLTWGIQGVFWELPLSKLRLEGEG